MNGEAGSSTLLAAALVAAGIVACLLVIDIANAVAARTQLETAADAAALAAAPVTFSAFGTSGDPVAEASLVAAANGGELISCQCTIDRSWSTRRVLVGVGADVRLLLLGRRHLQVIAAAEFQPVALPER